MLFEHRTYVCQPSAAGRVAALVGETAAQTADGGKLEGLWVTDIGPLGHVIELRSRADDNLPNVVPTLAERHADVRPAIKSVETSLLAPVIPFQPAHGTKNVYEWRHYRARPGFAEEWLKLFVDIMPTRQRYSLCAGLWRTVGGSPDQFDHLWVYDSLDQRSDIRAKVMHDPQWQALLKAAAPLLAEMNSIILKPTQHSPLQ